ncbi:MULTISPECIES: DMT family transporter [Moraxella]|uniref:Permease of the drug/metabolite transporter DMT superfamily n=1 Tax=Moraxella catarrhalis TaxID=480 RepID=A0A7Z1A4B6_MORCA|nr:DMT family transporter [Moraxella catarrhalis]OAV01456.1 Permease of the drug/metabolite transporter DMT superfamily [Moraxella catarrhalis]STY81650.1 Predicted permease, DMT superfamily [Moraxella catarrhalis]
MSLTNSNKLEVESLVNKFVPFVFLIIWSGGALFSKLGLQYADVWSFLFLRSALALSLLTMIFLSNKEYLAVIPTLKKNDFVRIIASGLLLQVLYLVFYFLSINTHLSLGMIILILGMQPIITKLATSNNVNYYDIALLGGCFIGLAIATLGYHKIEQINLLGIVMAACALISITFGTIIQSKITSNPILTLLLQTIVAFMIFGATTVMKGLSFNFNFYFISALLWMGAVVSVGAFLLLMRMLRHSNAEKASTLFFLLPLLTMVLESIFFHKHLNLLTIFGSIMVCVVLFIYQFKTFILNKTSRK